MRIETKQVKIYEFEELEKEVQEKLIEKERDYQQKAYCENFLKDDMEEKAIELLQKYFKNKAEFIRVFYDLGYCQGDGAMIEFYLNYYNKDLKIKQYGHYYHERSFTIENDYLLTDKQYEQLKEKIVNMNQELAKYGYKLIEYFNDCNEKEIISILQENEYLVNGEIY